MILLEATLSVSWLVASATTTRERVSNGTTGFFARARARWTFLSSFPPFLLTSKWMTMDDPRLYPDVDPAYGPPPPPFSIFP